MIMNLFHHQETPSKKCRFFKDALATCHTLCGRISSQSLQDDRDDDVTDYDDEQEVIISCSSCSCKVLTCSSFKKNMSDRLSIDSKFKFVKN